jgi:hypothetical protein
MRTGVLDANRCPFRSKTLRNVNNGGKKLTFAAVSPFSAPWPPQYCPRQLRDFLMSWVIRPRL